MNRYELIQHLHGLDVVSARKVLSEEVKRPAAERRQKIVMYHTQHNPLYKEKTMDWKSGRFEDLPIMRKSDFQKPLETIISDEYSLKDLYVANTSGSSGHPFYYAKNKEAHAIVHAIIERLYSEHGLSVCDKQARFYGIPLKGRSKYIEQVKDLLLNRVRFPIFDLSDDMMGTFLDRFRKNRFVYVYGYTSAIVLFCKYLKRNSLILKAVCPTLKACIITSEVCTPEDRKVIEKAMGVRVINEYGCSEAGMVAFEDVNGVWRMVDDDSYYEVVDNDGNVLPEGEEGRILITNYSNKALPFIRYEIGDLGVISHDEKGGILMKLTGRVSDVIKLPSGKIAGGLSFYYISRSIMEKKALIKEFIVRQTKPDTFEFDIVGNVDSMSDLKQEFSRQMDEYLEPGLNVVINPVDHIDRPESGKIKHFYSEL